MQQRVPSGALALLCAGALFAQHSTTRSNPFDSPLDREDGARMFRAQCAACHGPNGAGGASGPDLTSGLKRGESDEALFLIIGRGIPGTNMPPYAGSPREIWQLTAFVRSLSIGRGADLAKGNRERGRSIFESSGCRKCHVVGDHGGNLGPDLTAIGGVRSLVSLRNALVDPNSDVSPDYWRLRAVTRDGKKINGVRLNEDTYSFQYRDSKGLGAVLKSNLVESEIVRTSPMPAYGDKLKPAELEDLIAYLASLREQPRQQEKPLP